MSRSGLTRRSLLRVVGAGAASAVAGAAAAGCGTDDKAVLSDPGKVSGSVTMWIYPIDPNHEDAWWKPKISAFRKTYGKVDVKVVVQPWANRDEQLTTAITGRKGPDVVYLIPDQVPQYAQTGALADVSDVIAADRKDFRSNALSALSYDGKLYGVPLLMGGTGTLVNTKILAAAGISSPPQTWDDVLAAAPKLKAKGYYTTEYVADVAQTLNLTFYPLLWQAGGDVLSSDGKKATFNAEPGVRALTYVKKLVDGGYVPTQSLTKVPPAEADPVAHGKVAFVTGSAVADLEATAGINPDDWDVVAPLKDTTRLTYGVVGGLSVLDSAHDMAAAKAWVRWLAAPAQLKEFDRNRKYYSPRVSVGALFGDDRLLGAQEKYVGETRAGVIHPKARQLMDLIKPHLQAALLGKVPPAQALDDAAKEVDDLLARG
jgi:multiple sugar transport system substrate-binding protein